MVDNPMIAIERGIRSGYGVFVDGKLAVASKDAEGALVGVAGVLEVNLLHLLRKDEAQVREAVIDISAENAAKVIVTLLVGVGVNAPERKIHAIKAIRALTGCGLKPAKDALEDRFARGI